MKLSVIGLGFGLAVLPWHVQGGEEMIDYLRSIIQTKGPEFCGCCEEVRELKYPGQAFLHEIDMTIQGTGQAVTPRCWGWFKERRTMHITHVSYIRLFETIESTEKDLKYGVIKSRYRVLNIDERLLSATKNIELGRFSASDIGKWVKGVCEKCSSDKIEESKLWWLRPVNHVLIEWDKKIASDGTFVADKDFIEKNLPGYSAAVGKLRDFKNTEITSLWQFGNGYTSIKFEKTSLPDEDQKMIAKLIYRTNPMSINDVLPEDKKSGDSWVIDSRVIGGVVYDLGLNFDSVEGAVMCRHNGIELLDKDDAADEFRLLKKDPMRSVSLEVPRDNRNRMKLVSHNGKMGDVALSFSPYGTMTVFDEHDEKGRHLYYLRELKMDGTVNSKVSRTTSLLKDVEFTGTDLKVKLTYTQTRAR